MCKNYKGLEFKHFVVIRTDGTIFGSARENGNGHTYNFLIRRESVHTQQGDQWLEVEPDSIEAHQLIAEALNK